MRDPFEGLRFSENYYKKVINKRGSLKQIVIEKVSVVVNIDFSWPTS